MNQSAVDEALLGEAAETMLSGTQDASWRIYISQTVLDEVQRVLVEPHRAVDRGRFFLRQIDGPAD